ncbi:MAG: prepilin-type N-terminal cleavage/methylation domain-containing protein [Candidatus Levybacteria bacterium]|nr:prepilin-type N-terminal cleavage/methylation domain-containing protein [Candidatus Levybacteria bacterium]
MNYKLRIKNKGFTLIELLIVVAIIGILSTLLMANFIGIRQRARDGQRKSDLNQIRGALEMYRADQGSYPNPSLSACGGSISQAATIYMQKIPCDPTRVDSYYYSSNGTTYTLSACLENTSDLLQGTGTYPGGPSSCSSSFYYVLNNP